MKYEDYFEVHFGPFDNLSYDQCITGIRKVWSITRVIAIRFFVMPLSKAKQSYRYRLYV